MFSFQAPGQQVATTDDIRLAMPFNQKLCRSCYEVPRTSTAGKHHCQVRYSQENSSTGEHWFIHCTLKGKVDQEGVKVTFFLKN